MKEDISLIPNENNVYIYRVDGGLLGNKLELGEPVFLKVNISGENLYATIENNYLVMISDKTKAKICYVITYS